MRRLAFLLWLVFMGWAATASAQAKEALLRYNYLPGESRTYGLGVAGTGTASLAGISAPLEFTATSAMTQTCKSIADDGGMEIEAVSAPAAVKVTFDGEPVDVGNLPTQEMKMTMLLYSDGRVQVPGLVTQSVVTDDKGNTTVVEKPVEAVPIPKGGALGFLGVEVDPTEIARAATTTLLPQEKVSEGSSWAREVQVPLPGGKLGQLKATSTLSGFEVRDGIDCVVLDTEFSLPLSMEFSGLGINLEGWAVGKVREVATVEQMKTIEQKGDVSLSLASAAASQEGETGAAEGETMGLLGPGLLSNISVTISASFNTFLQQ